MPLATIAFQALVITAAVVLFTRLHGVRSFSKMSGFDFAITVSFGSILASTVMAPDQSVWIGVAALAALFLIQVAIAQSRARGLISGLVDNRPILVMRGTEILDDNLRTAGMTRADLYGKLREANAFDFATVHYVIAEPTGDVSVLHGDGPSDSVDSRLLDDLRQ